jgi:hypothetical protein
LSWNSALQVVHRRGFDAHARHFELLAILQDLGHRQLLGHDRRRDEHGVRFSHRRDTAGVEVILVDVGDQNQVGLGQ